MAIPVPIRRIWLSSLIVWCWGISLAVAAEPAIYTFRSDVSEVRLTFSVVDQNHHGVATLQAGDVVVVDKDIIVRKFQSFTRADWTKLELAILIDTSASATPHFRQELADVVGLVAQAAGIPDENLSIFSFQDQKPTLLCAGACRANRPLPETRAAGLTPLFDTIVFAAEFLSHRGDAHTQRVLIVFSDGADTISRHSLRDAIDAALQSEIQIESVDLNRASYSPSAAALRSLANSTGGRYFPPPGGAEQALNLILECLQASYTVSYRIPSRDLGFHNVVVFPTRNLNLQFRSRSGYYISNQIH